MSALPLTRSKSNHRAGSPLRDCFGAGELQAICIPLSGKVSVYTLHSSGIY